MYIETNKMMYAPTMTQIRPDIDPVGLGLVWDILYYCLL